MSDMMQGAPPAPQAGGLQDKMSMLNPTDMAAKVSKGDIRPNQTVAEFLQRNFGVAPQDPVEKLFQAVKGQVGNATMAGKMGVPQGRPQPSPMGGGPPSPGGLDGLIGKMQQ